MGKKLAEVTILSNDEGLFYGVESEEMEKINVPATIEEYQKQCRKTLELLYPECDFIFKHEPYSGKSIRIVDLTDDFDFDVMGYESDIIQEICGRVFEYGSFWTTK